MKSRKNIYQVTNDFGFKTHKELNDLERVSSEIWGEMDTFSQEVVREFTELNTTADDILKEIKIVKWVLIVIVVALFLIIIK